MTEQKKLSENNKPENPKITETPFEPTGADPLSPEAEGADGLSNQPGSDLQGKSATQPRAEADSRKEAHRRIAALRETLETTRYVGKAEDLVPFAWNKPLLLCDNKKQSRVLKTMALQEAERIRTAQIEQSEE